MTMPYEIGGTSLAHMDFDREDSIAASSKQSNTSKKVHRRSSRTYRCPVQDCGKAYSRAEHLSRHQLNHDPKKIYCCDVPNCSRSFVRLDLYSLHRTRHMGEYMQQQNDYSSSHSGSAHTPEFMDYSTESTLNHGSQSQLLPQYRRNTAQIGYDQEPQQSQQSQAEACSTFGMTEIPSQTPLPSSQSNQMEIISQQQQHLPDISMWRNEVHPPTSIPLFGGDSYTPPFTITDDFIQYLFNGSTPSQLTNTDGTSSNSIPSYIHTQGTLYGSMNHDIFSEGYIPQAPVTININSSETNFSSMSLSYEKSQEIFDLVQNKFTGNTHPHSINGQSTLLDGDRSQDSNIMSRKRMQDHIDSYWDNFHSQLPILHRPSFSPNKTPNLLLIAVMIIGASCSIQPDDHVMTKPTREFSEVLAWYLRWEIFGSMHIQSDNLWVFQTLLLLETYEKTYSSRTLHERAHIHHATAITLMRRGGFLVGRSPLDSPPEGEEDASGSYRTARPTKDVYWDEWIRRESTRRVALAAFMIDSLHAAMFGHSIVMVTHEMRLVLPCDDTLWSATSVDEVRKIEMTLRSNGVKPLSFLEGLQKTLNGQEIYTNPFGRSILLCGLLSVSWHMNQRDLQINSLDVSSQEGVRGSKWRRSITRAFNLWRSAYERMSPNISDDADVLHGSRFALYHLAQFSVNVDIVECQIFAGASRVLGRSMGKQDVETARRRIRNTWAKSVEARRATFYALRFLCLVLNKPNSNQVIDCEYIHKYATSNNTLPMHRWVLYSAALIVWCYSYAVDGPMHSNASVGNSIEDHIRDMSAFLERAENIKSPEDVAFHRLNGCTGMLKVLRYTFRISTWELLHEGADLLTNCIKLMETVG